MLVKPNWDNFQTKFSENPQDNFEWFCYLLFSQEYNQPYGTHRYKNQSGIETDPIKVGVEVIGWQSKFYGDSLSNHKDDLTGTLKKTKRDNPTITKIILYTNSEWGQGQGEKEPKAKTDTEEKAKELEIKLVWRVRSYFESPFVCQEQRDISRYFFELDSKWEFSEYGFKDRLISKYKQNFKTISLLINNNTKPIKEIFVNLAIIKDKEEEIQNKEYKREALLSSYEEIHKPKEPIEIEELIKASKKSLIYGKAGVGKTTLCKYIAYQWANEKLYDEFDYLIYISLREWKTKGLRGAIKDNYYSQDDKDITLDIKENSQKILFLFDGYDELVEEKKRDLQKEIEAYGLSHYIITSRPYGYQRNDFKVDEHFETIGFTDENVEKYIENFFNEVEKQKALKEFLQSNIGIKHIAYIPLMLEMICSLWKDERFSDSLTMTELYTKVIDNILMKHSASKDDKRVYTRQNRREIKNILGKIAFEGLTQQSIFFDGDLIEDAIGNIEFFEENVIYSGFLKSDRQEKDLLDNNFEFHHLTFQEYFSALYIASLSQEEQSEIIRDWKFYPHMQMFFAFLGGLIENKEFLLGGIECEPKDLVGFYEFVLILNCIDKPSVLEHNRKIYLLENFFVWLKFSIREGLNYENILEKMIFISDIIDEEFVNKYIEIIISKDILACENQSQTYKIKLTKYINTINNKNDFFINKLLFLLNKNIPLKTKNGLIRAFISLNRKDIKVMKIIFKILNNAKIDNTVKVELSRQLSYLKKIEIVYMDQFLKLIENENIIYGIKLEIAKFLRGINIIQNNKYKNEFKCIIENNFIDKKIRNILEYSLLYVAYSKDEKSLIDLINTNMIDKSILVKGIKSHINNFNLFIEIIKNYKISFLTRSLILHTLITLKKDEQIFIDMLIDKTFDKKMKGVLLKSLITFKKNDLEFFKIIISMIKDNPTPNLLKPLGKALFKSSNIHQKNHLNHLLEILNDASKHNNIRLPIARALSLIKDDSVLNLFISILKTDNNKKIKIEITKLLIKIGKNDNNTIDYIIDIIQDKKYDLSSRTIIVTDLIFFTNEKNKDEIINRYISIIKDEKIDKTIRQLFIVPLMNINNRLDQITNEFLKIVKNENILFSTRHSIVYSLSFSKEKQLYAFRELGKYENIFFKNMSLINLYQLYDENYDVVKYIINNILVNELNTYIKNNKLYTIENGKEISTKREIDEIFLKEVESITGR